MPLYYLLWILRFCCPVRFKIARLTVQYSMLLTHSSGLVYDHMGNKLLTKWFELKKVAPMNRRSEVTPLIFDPGENWAYGPSSDWAGWVVSSQSVRILSYPLSDQVLISHGHRSKKLPECGSALG
jgi:hypothetical protein